MLDLYGNIEFDGASEQVVEGLYKSLGTRQVKMADGKTLEQKLVSVINRVAIIGKEAAQSKVPIDTGELRNDHIHIDPANKNKVFATVYIDDGEHTSYGKRSGKEASYLASILNIPGKGFRSRESDNVTDIVYGKFSSISAGSRHRGWITSATRAFELTVNNQIERLF